MFYFNSKLVIIFISVAHRMDAKLETIDLWVNWSSLL